LKFVIGSAISLLAFLIAFSWAAGTNLAGWTTITQMPVSGTMSVYTDPGMYWSWGGTETAYKQACTISFGNDKDETTIHDSAAMPAISVQFNDNGTAMCYGNVRYELPVEHDRMQLIHNKYRSYQHLVDALLAKHTANVVGATAQMFSAEDTYSGARAEFQRLAQDQLQNGIYQTDVKEVETEDPLSHEKRRGKKVSIRKDTNGNPLRVDNPLNEFGIKCSQFLLSRNFQYEEGVLAQISAQREAYMRTVTARAVAQQATQDVITAKARGEAEATTAEYKKLVIQKEAVVEAETEKKVAETQAEKQKAVAELTKQMFEIQAKQRLEVATLDKQAAEQTRQKDILLGEGEASRKKAIMEADGALELKLQALKEINQAYAQAIKDYRGNWMPTVQMGAANGSDGMSSASQLINMLMIKTAKDLAIDQYPTTPTRGTEPTNKN
jgi:regulator of protease activity HflC (stomatin/prohibitin superfamily)